MEIVKATFATVRRSLSFEEKLGSKGATSEADSEIITVRTAACSSGRLMFSSELFGHPDSYLPINRKK